MPPSGDPNGFVVSLLVGGVVGLFLLAVCCVLYFHRRLTLRRLAESEGRFRILFEHGGVGLALLSAEGVVVQANPALEQMLGYEPGRLCGVRLSDLSHPADRSDDTHRLRQQPPNPAADQSEREKRYLRKDGGVIWARVVRAAVRDAAGAVCYHASVLIDVTERRRAEEELRRTEEDLRQERDFTQLMLQTADALMVVLDLHGRIVRFNAKCAVLSGCTEAEAVGRPIWDLLPERVRESVRAGFARLAEQTSPPAQPVHLDLAWASPGGERLIDWRASRIYEPDGRVRYVIGVGLDVTEKRRLEEQVRQSQKLETLATLVGGISHDFNNQLTTIVGNLNLALEDLRAAEGGPPPHDETLRNLRAWTEAAEDAAQRCAAMTARLLTFSRGRIGARQALHLNQLLPEAARLLRAELPPAVRVEVGADDDVWPVNGDWGQLHQAIYALAVNARDAMPGGGVLTLAVANRVVGPEEAADPEARPGRFVELLVQDDGRGMTPEVRARLFEPFFTTKAGEQGAGLGLSEVYGIIKGHQGWIRVESEPGRGSAFRLHLPAATESSPAGPAPPAAAAGGGECILVVDDEDMVRDLARLVLERRGFRVMTAADGEEALAQYGAHPGRIDLVLLDYSMPGLTGLQVFEALRKLDPKVCVVFSSGYGLQGDATPLLAAGARAFVAKPYRPDELAETIRKALAEKAENNASV